MSWSKTYTGTPNAVIEQATVDLPTIEEGLPEHERGDVQRVISAAALLLHEWNPRSHITLHVSGHGYRDNAQGTGGGGLRVQMDYKIGE